MQEINVQVAVRVRPQLDREKLKHDGVCVFVKPLTNEVFLGKDRCFVFDSVFPIESSQVEIYETSVKPLVKSCFEGYNATVFAYGQTGSGKTFTMGSQTLMNCSSEDLGVIPRAINGIFQIAESLEDKTCTLRVSFLEVYKDELIDLLDAEYPKDISIREDPLGNTFVAGCSQAVCTDLEEVMEKLWKGSLHRRTGATQMNDQSSRSHTIFTLYIEQVDIAKNSDANDSEIGYTCAKFHFVDLAGSERANRTGNVGERFIESIHINTGLLALGNVISALGDQKKKIHIPYRDSKITRLLKDSLGGNSRTLMICCVSPSVSDYDETLNSLKYAKRARSIKNRPVINHNPCVLQVENLKTEIETLKEALRQEKEKAISYDTSKVNKFLQEELSRLQLDCSKYYNVANEAFKHIKSIQDKTLLSQSLDDQLNQWIEVMQNLKHWNDLQIPECYNSESMLKLQSELKKKEKQLELRDETIFKQDVEIAKLTAQINKLLNENIHLNLNSCNDDLDDDLKNQDEVFTENSKKLIASESGFVLTRERAKSVPSQMIGTRRLQVKDRNIHTSSGYLTVEKIGDILKLRNDCMNSEMEDGDNVSTFRESHENLFQKDGQEICLNRKKTFKLKMIRDKEPLLNPKAMSSLGLSNEKQDTKQIKLLEETIRCLEAENNLLRQDIIQYKNDLVKKDQKSQDEITRYCSLKNSFDMNNHSKTLAKRQEVKLITSKLKSVTNEEMRHVVTASSNWINEQINAHLEDKVLNESLREDILARNKLIHEKELLEKLRNELQQKLAGNNSKLISTNTNASVESGKQIAVNTQDLTCGNSVDYQLLNEYEETLEAIEETIKFRNGTIACKQEDLHKSQSKTKNESFFLGKINSLSPTETNFLLFKFFKKIIELKHEKRKLSTANEDMKITLNERDTLIRELELQLRGLSSEHEKKIRKQNQDFNEKLGEVQRNYSDIEKILKEKICDLGKDVLYYKSMYRESKNKAKLKSSECQDLTTDCQEISNQKSARRKIVPDFNAVQSSRVSVQSQSQSNNSKLVNAELKEILTDSLEAP